jgi:hypothetical protein
MSLPVALDTNGLHLARCEGCVALISFDQQFALLAG